MTWLRYPFLCLLILLSHCVTAKEDHTPFGTLYHDTLVLDRNAYTAFYSERERIPKLVSYHVLPNYRETPPRKKRFKKYRTDPDVKNAVVNSDYTNSGFARGHMAPFFISGGDRDNDGTYAQLEADSSDLDDELTIFQVNYFTNFTPQHQVCFNGSGGVWYGLETFVRKKLLENGEPVQIYAGAITSPTSKRIGPQNDISVPDSFFKILVQTQPDGNRTALAFHFPHYQKDTNDQCNDDERKFYDPKHLVTVGHLENLTGIDFFSELPVAKQNLIESQSGAIIWSRYYSAKL